MAGRQLHIRSLRASLGGIAHRSWSLRVVAAAAAGRALVWASLDCGAAEGLLQAEALGGGVRGTGRCCSCLQAVVLGSLGRGGIAFRP